MSAAAPACRWNRHTLILITGVRPNAPRTELAVQGEALRLSVQCPPLDGRANRGAVTALAKAFRVRGRSIELLNSEPSRVKLFRIVKPRRLLAVVEAMLLKSK